MSDTRERPKTYFGSITIQEKSRGDWRAFLGFRLWENGRTSETLYEIRGYGNSPDGATKDAYDRYLNDVEDYIYED